MRILVAGTEELLRPVGRSFLGRSGFEVLKCSAGREVLQLAEQKHPDLIILGDVTDPAPVDCWRMLQSGASTARVPILLILGDTDDALVPEGAARAGFDEPDRIVEQAALLLAVRRREHRRRHLKIRVEFYGAEREGVGHTRDLSESGMFLRCDEGLAPGDRLQLIFGLPAPGRPTIRAIGEVVRRQPPTAPDGAAIGGLGIVFRKVGQRDRRAIADLVGSTHRVPS